MLNLTLIFFSENVLEHTKIIYFAILKVVRLKKYSKNQIYLTKFKLFYENKITFFILCFSFML